jgi:hypothetical protein
VDLESAVNLGGNEYITVTELAQTVIEVSGKEIGIEYVEGPVGGHSRNFLTRPTANRWAGKPRCQ